MENTQLAAPSAPSTAISLGFENADTFALLQRAAKMLSNSTLVPAQYRCVKEIKEYGKVVRTEENPNAVANCVIALNIARRMRADELMVMQNLYVVEGRPSWSSQWVIAAVNTCGKFSPLRYEITDLGTEDMEYTVVDWEQGKKVTRKERVKMSNIQCIAWAIEKATGERLEGPPVDMAMAVAEGWYGKNGSKWQTMPQMMLRYRSASFFGKLYAPELLMGLPTAEEAHEEAVQIREVVGREVPPAEMPNMFSGAVESNPAAVGNPEPAHEQPAAPPQKRSRAAGVKKDTPAPAQETPAADPPQEAEPSAGGSLGETEAEHELNEDLLVPLFWKAVDDNKMDRDHVMAILKKNAMTEADTPDEVTEDEMAFIQPLWTKLKASYVAEKKKTGGVK